MKEIPYSTNQQPNYENFIAECPWCTEENIFNRRDDLKTYEPIACQVVRCSNKSCRKEFKINSDSINSAYEMLIFRCYELIQKKQYMNCALSIAQAYEVFFNLYLRVEFLYKPFSRQQERDITELNKTAKLLNKKIERYSYWQMRSLFLRLILLDPKPQNLIESKQVISEFSPCDPMTNEIESSKLNQELKELLVSLKNVKINNIRNKVVHKKAYRPSKTEIDIALTEARKVLFGLNRHLKLYDEPNWYIDKANH